MECNLQNGTTTPYGGHYYTAGYSVIIPRANTAPHQSQPFGLFMLLRPMIEFDWQSPMALSPSAQLTSLVL